MTAKMPPIPPQNRSPKGTGGPAHAEGKGKTPDAPKAAGKTGQSGNVRVNLTNQGQQQDR